jgi:hypothetical protein
MPAILIRILGWLMTSMAGQVLYSLGLGMISFTALQSLYQWLEMQVATWFMGTADNYIIAMNLIEADYYISVLLSAYAIKATMTAAQVAFKRT